MSMVGSGSLAAMGIWCLLFGADGDSGRDRERGQGQRQGEKSKVSGWPFRNAEATRVKLENREEKRKLMEEEERREGARRRGRGGGGGMEMGIEMEDMGGKKGV